LLHNAALNYALAFARGDFVVIYDAEDRPDPGQLHAALDAFDAGDARLACVQAPLFWYNASETWLTRQFALEYAALFHVVLPALARWGWPLPLGGTSNHFRRSALEDAAGWDPYNVTEDADLGFRLAELGYVSTVITLGTGEEAITTERPWTRQRARWIKGFLQTLLVRLANLPALARNGGVNGLASLALTIALPLASSFVHGPMAVFTLLALATGSLSPAAAGVLAAGYAVAAATAYTGLVRSSQKELVPAIALMPLYWPLLTIAAVRAVWDLAVRPFHWEKTRHGVTTTAERSSFRTAPPRPDPLLASPSFRGEAGPGLSRPPPPAASPVSRATSAAAASRSGRG
jgi:cellulose synthase/poly-beta-1,6-N-acetylglucosamine synthase-like glycosyltransferase